MCFFFLCVLSAFSSGKARLQSRHSKRGGKGCGGQSDDAAFFLRENTYHTMLHDGNVVSLSLLSLLRWPRVDSEYGGEMKLRRLTLIQLGAGSTSLRGEGVAQSLEALRFIIAIGAVPPWFQVQSCSIVWTVECS